MPKRDVSFAISMFKRVGLRAVWAQQEDLYMLTPEEPGEREVYGSAVLSARVMIGINEYLSKLTPQASADGSAAVGSSGT